MALSPFDGATNSVVAALDLDPGKRSGRHAHSIEEVILVLAGTAEMAVGDEQARLSVGDVVLVTGAAGGVGSAAVGIARWKGALAIGAIKDEPERPAAENAGAEVIIDTSEGG